MNSIYMYMDSYWHLDPTFFYLPHHLHRYIHEKRKWLWSQVISTVFLFHAIDDVNFTQWIPLTTKYFGINWKLDKKSRKKLSISYISYFIWDSATGGHKICMKHKFTASTTIIHLVLVFFFHRFSCHWRRDDLLSFEYVVQICFVHTMTVTQSEKMEKKMSNLCFHRFSIRNENERIEMLQPPTDVMDKFLHHHETMAWSLWIWRKL